MAATDDFSVPTPTVTLNDTEDLAVLARVLEDAGYGALATILGHGHSRVWNRDNLGDRAVVVKASREAAALMALAGISQCDRVPS